MEVSYRKFKKQVYRELAQNCPLKPIDYQDEILYLLKDLDIGKLFLDLGCGSGDLLLEASARLGPEGQGWGFDISHDMLDVARTKVAGKENIRLKQGDITLGLPFSDNYFDLVVSANVLQEIPSISFLIEEIYRVLKDNGRFRLLIPCLEADNQISRYFSLLARQYFWYFHSKGELKEILTNSQFPASKIQLTFHPNPCPGFTQELLQLKGFDHLLEEFAKIGYDQQDIRQGVFLAEGIKER